MNENNCPKTKKTIEISFNWAVTIFVGAILTGLVGGAFTVGSILNSDHFTLAANVEDTKELKDNYQTLIRYIGDIKTDIGEIKGELRIK